MVKRPDIISLRGFYKSPLGKALQSRLWEFMAKHLPAASGFTSVGVGYGTPYLREVMNTNSAKVIALMPANQGAVYWPIADDNHTALITSEHWPLADNAVEQVYLFHALEYEDYPADLLREAWRVLAPGGQLFVAAPLRYGLWQKLGDTPYRKGVTTSAGDLKKALSQAGFTWIHSHLACCAPPVKHASLAPFWPIIDRLCCAVLPFFSSVILVEAEKQIYAAMKKRQTVNKTAKSAVIKPIGVTTARESQ